MPEFTMKKLVLGLAGVAALSLGLATAAEAACSKKHPCKTHHGASHPSAAYHARHHHYPRVYAADPYYYNYGPRPLYVYGGSRYGIFDFPPDAPGGLLNPEPRPVNQNPQQWMMNQQQNRPFSDNTPY